MKSQKTCSFILAVVALLLSACGVASQPSSKAATAPRPQIVSYSAQAFVQSNQNTHQVSASASCKQGEQMLGGGFATSDVFEYDAFIEANYPSNATTWTVTGGSSPSFQLEVYVYCLKAADPLGIQIVQSGGTPGGQIACPKGTTILSGGFQGSQPAQASYPLGNGWYGASVDSTTRIYALCAAQPIMSGSVVTAAFNAQSSSHQYQSGSASVDCPTGQVATSGGFASHGDLILASSTNGQAFSDWFVAAGGDAEVTISAVCWAFKG